MSIYRVTDKVPLSDVTTVTGTHAPGAKSQNDEDWTTRRAAEPANGLLQPTVNWALALPPHALPNALRVKFPPIANLLAVLWQDPNSLRRYVDDLLVKCGDRQGFPLDILRELFALRAYYDEVPSRVSSPLGGHEQRRVKGGAAPLREHARRGRRGGVDRMRPGG